MQKGDAFSLGPRSRLLIHQLDASCSASLECGVQIRHGKAQVVNAGATPRDETAHWRVPGLGLEKLDERFPDLERGDPRSIGIVDWNRVQAEHVAEKGRLSGGGHDRQPDVGQPHSARGSGTVFAW